MKTKDLALWAMMFLVLNSLVALLINLETVADEMNPLISQDPTLLFFLGFGILALHLVIGSVFFIILKFGEKEEVKQ